MDSMILPAHVCVVVLEAVCLLTVVRRCWIVVDGFSEGALETVKGTEDDDASMGESVIIVFFQRGDPLVLLEQEAVGLVDCGEQGHRGRIGILGHGYVHVGGVIVVLLVGPRHGNLCRGRSCFFVPWLDLFVPRLALHGGGEAIVEQVFKAEWFTVWVSVVVVADHHDKRLKRNLFLSLFSKKWESNEFPLTAPLMVPDQSGSSGPATVIFCELGVCL